MATYASREIVVSADTSRAPGSGAWAKPRRTRSATIASVRAGSTTPLARRFPPETTRAPAIAQSVTVLTSPGSKRTAVPAAMSRRMPYARPRSKRSAAFVSMKW